MFISSAMAQTTDVATQAATTGSTDMLGMGLQFVVILAILYFLLIRPQQKRIKQHESQLNAIQIGTRVVVAGITGKVVNIKDEMELEVEIADGVRINVLRPYISQVIFDDKKQEGK